jgi:hypothetical protein
VVPIPSTESHSVARGFVHIIQKRAFGIPDSVSTDGGSHFLGDFDKMCEFFSIKHVILRVYPRFVDRFIRTVRDAFWMRRKGMDLRGWHLLLPEVLSQYNERIHAGTGMAPQKLLQEPAKDPEVFHRMVEDSNLSKKKPLEMGDQVRILNVEKEWKKSEAPTWSETLHVVLGVHHTSQGTLYDVSSHTQMLTRSSLLFVAKPGVSANEMPNVGRPLEERLTMRQEGLARKYKEHLPLAIRILWYSPGRRLKTQSLVTMIGVPFKNGADFVRLYPRYLKQQGLFTTLTPGVREAEGYRSGADLLAF